MASKEKKTSERDSGDSEMIRRFKQNPFVFIGTLVILIIVIIAFVLVPIMPEYGMGSMDKWRTFGYYDKVPIRYVDGNYFAQYISMEEQRYRQYNIDIDNIDLMRYIWRSSFEAAAIHTAMLQEMKVAGYAPPERVVDREVAKLPSFQENGRFSPALYRQMDENRRLTLWRQVKDDLIKSHFQSDVTGLLVSDAEADFIGKMAAAERSFEMAIFSVDAYPDGEYVAYAEANADLFRSIHLSMITVSSSEREAQGILASIKNGETTFEDAARAHSRDYYADMGGDMGIRMAHELNYDIPEEADRTALLAMARGEYSGVLKTSMGWSFFRIEESAQEADTSDPATLDKVRYYMRNFQRGLMEDWATAEANDFRNLVEDVGFTRAVLLRGVESRSFGPVPLNYGSVDLFGTLGSQSVSEISDSGVNEGFWKAAFSTPVETPSVPVVQGSNVFVLFPTAETEAEAESIEGIVSTYKSYWIENTTGQSLWQFFTNSPKLDVRFDEAFNRLFSAGS